MATSQVFTRSGQLVVVMVAHAGPPFSPMKAASSPGQKVRGAGGQPVPVKFCVWPVLTLLRLTTLWVNALHAPEICKENEPGFTAKVYAPVSSLMRIPCAEPLSLMVAPATG